MALSVETNFNIFDDISATPYQFSSGVTVALAAVSNPASPWSNGKAVLVSIFSGAYRLQKPVNRRHNTRSRRNERFSSFQLCWHHPEILAQPPNAIGG